MHLSTLMIALLFLGALINVNAVPFPYPIEASWFADRYTTKEWQEALNEFSSQGGSIVWQRGRTVRPRDYGDLLRDPDMQWCYTPSPADPTNVIPCQQWAQEIVASHNATIANWLYYDYNEGYGSSIIACPQLELRINTSRVYWILVLPNAANQSVCNLNSGDSVNVLITFFDGIDSKELLVHTAEQLNMQVYLGMPGLPILDSAPWTVNASLLPAFYEFNRRVLSDYGDRYGKHSAFAGVYQSLEISLAGDIAAAVVPAYTVLAQTVHTLLPGRRFVLSPYEDVLAGQPFNNTVAEHAANLKLLARAGADVIAVQEGRGVGTAAYFYDNQINNTIASIDPLLLRLRQYRAPTTPASITFGGQYIASIRDLFDAYATAQAELAAEEGLHFELWANVEAFEYTRYAPCTPIDPVGNGMAELLDRTAKYRIDWAIQFEAPFVQHFISFAWDSNYLCSAKTGYNTSLASEIRSDYLRPIVANASFVNESCTMSVLGFNFAVQGIKLIFTWTDASSGNAMNASWTPSSIDSNYGNKNRLPPLLQEATVEFIGQPMEGTWISVSASSALGGTSYHPVWIQVTNAEDCKTGNGHIK